MAVIPESAQFTANAGDWLQGVAWAGAKHLPASDFPLLALVVDLPEERPDPILDAELMGSWWHTYDPAASPQSHMSTHTCRDPPVTHPQATTCLLTLAIALMSHITPIRATEGVVIVFAREPTLEVIILEQAGLAPEALMNNLLDVLHTLHCEWLAGTIPGFTHTLISEGRQDKCIPTDWPQMSGIDTHPYLYILVFDIDDGAPFSRLSIGRTSCPSLPMHTVRTSSLGSRWGFKGGMTAIVPFLLVKGTMAWKVIVTLVQAAGAAEYVNNVTREMVDAYYPVLDLKVDEVEPDRAGDNGPAVAMGGPLLLSLLLLFSFPFPFPFTFPLPIPIPLRRPRSRSFSIPRWRI
ncbi:hypothetical protein K466DRAFT_571050, partial [Polyporus arcularius HHB13444]